jgi:carboxylesterase type B
MGSDVWLGMRFADPPTRFQRAQPPSKTGDGIVQASHRANVCAQMSTGPGITASELIVGDEDCLFLNVYAPQNVSRASPVVVWIHGGGYGYGSPNAFGEETKVIDIDEGKTILVSITYRTNIFGFLSSTEIKSQGSVNLGVCELPF